MTAREFMNLGLKEKALVNITLKNNDNSSRTVKLYFRGYTIKDNKRFAHSPNDLKPLFSAPNNRGGINRTYYSAIETNFENITSITPLEQNGKEPLPYNNINNN